MSSWWMVYLSVEREIPSVEWELPYDSRSTIHKIWSARMRSARATSMRGVEPLPPNFARTVVTVTSAEFDLLYRGSIPDSGTHSLSHQHTLTKLNATR